MLGDDFPGSNSSVSEKKDAEDFKKVPVRDLPAFLSEDVYEAFMDAFRKAGVFLVKERAFSRLLAGREFRTDVVQRAVCPDYYQLLTLKIAHFIDDCSDSTSAQP